MPPPRVLMIAAPAAFGGAESVLASLATGLQAAGAPVAVALITDGPAPAQLAERLAQGNVAVQLVASTPRGYLHEARSVLALARRFEADVLHTHGYRCDLVIGTAARSAGIRWVSTAHGFTSETRRLRAYEAAQRWSWRRADAVVAVSRPLRDRIVRSGVSEACVQLIPNALPAVKALSKVHARERLGLADGPVVVWVGRLSAEKGPDVALDAWAHLGAPRPTLVIIGDGPDRKLLQAQADRLGLAEHVRFLGVRSDVRDVLPAFDVLLLSSRTEGTPMVLLEAMHAGVPIVATSVGGVPDVLGEGAGVLVPAESPPAVAEAIEGLLSDRERACAQAEAGAERLAAEFSHAAWISRHELLYASLSAR